MDLQSFPVPEVRGESEERSDPKMKGNYYLQAVKETAFIR